jgi:hypothetical protein
MRQSQVSDTRTCEYEQHAREGDRRAALRPNARPMLSQDSPLVVIALGVCPYAPSDQRRPARSGSQPLARIPAVYNCEPNIDPEEPSL